MSDNDAASNIVGFVIVFLIVLGSSIWVFFDAKSIGVKKGQIKGVVDMGPAGWFVLCLGMWIVGFPVYLANRSEFKRINGKAGLPSGQSTAAPAVDIDQQLRRLAKLKEDGVISQADFDEKKKSLLGL